jgi:hypothetical protein
MPHTPESDGGEAGATQTGGELTERLLARRVNVGVIDVGRVQRQYAGTADWVAERFAVLGDLNARYGTTTSLTTGSASPLPIANGHYTRTDSETLKGPVDPAPSDAMGLAPETVAPPAAGGGGGEASTLRRKARGPERAPASPATPATPATKESPPPLSASPPSVMTLAVETPTMPSLDVSPAVGSPEAGHADAPPADDTRVAGVAKPSVPAAPPHAPESVRGIGEGHEAAIQRTFAPRRGLAAEPASFLKAAEPEPRSHLVAQESPLATSGPAPTIMRATRGAEDSTAILRGAAAGVDASRERTAEPTSDASPKLTTVVDATVQRAAAATAHASEARTQTRLSAPEIQQSPALPLAARMVWRKVVAAGAAPAGGQGAARGSMPYVTPASASPPGVNTQTLYRSQASPPTLARAASEVDGGTTPAPAAPAQPEAGGVSLEQITEHVSRVILRRIAVEQERRGARRWL